MCSIIIDLDKSNNQTFSNIPFCSAEKLLGDDTQRALLPFLAETERSLSALIAQYDNNGYARILPSLDVGLPNNLVRLAGGFVTGMLLYWNCSVPLAFPDATVNVCSSSYFELDMKDDNIGWFCEEKISSALNASALHGYDINILSGNHFISLCKSSVSNRYYLVMHFSEASAKDSFHGLYPGPHVWYNNSLKTFTYNTRNIRYLTGESAEQFIQKAHFMQDLTTQAHLWLAKQIAGNLIVSHTINHHYGMPLNNVITIGTFLARPTQILPIFSNDGLPIYLYETSNSMWRVKICEEEYVLVPHGWGQILKSDKPYSISISGRKIVISSDSSNPYVFDTQRVQRFPDNLVNIRNFNSQGLDFFNIGQQYLNGRIVDTLKQRAIYSRRNNGVKYYE